MNLVVLSVAAITALLCVVGASAQCNAHERLLANGNCRGFHDANRKRTITYYGRETATAVNKLRAFDVIVINGGWSSANLETIRNNKNKLIIGYVSLGEHAGVTHAGNNLVQGSGDGPVRWDVATQQLVNTNGGVASFYTDQQCLADAEHIAFDGVLDDWTQLCPGGVGQLCMLNDPKKQRLVLSATGLEGSTWINVDTHQTTGDANGYDLKLRRTGDGSFKLMWLYADGSTFNFGDPATDCAADTGVWCVVDAGSTEVWINVERAQEAAMDNRFDAEHWGCHVRDTSGRKFCPTIAFANGDAAAQQQFKFTNGTCVGWHEDGEADETAWGGSFALPNQEYWDLVLQPQLTSMVDAGYDGFFFDTLDAAEIYNAPRSYPWFVDEMAATVARIDNDFPNHLKLANRGFSFFTPGRTAVGNPFRRADGTPFLPFESGVRDHVDGVVFESLYWSHWELDHEAERQREKNRCLTLPKLIASTHAAGQTLFVIDYQFSQTNTNDWGATVLDKYALHGFLADDYSLDNPNKKTALRYALARTRDTTREWMDTNYPEWLPEWIDGFEYCRPNSAMDADVSVLLVNGKYHVNFNAATRATSYDVRVRQSSSNSWTTFKKVSVFLEPTFTLEDRSVKALSFELPASAEPQSSSFEVQVRANPKQRTWSATGNACSALCAAQGKVCGADGTCIACTVNAHCAAFSPATPVCQVGASGAYECVECSFHGHCDGNQDGRNYCDVAANTCVECALHEQCSAGQVCDVGPNVCVDCMFDSDCTGSAGGNVCFQNTCIGCLYHSQCPGGGCAQSGPNMHQCVGCWEHSHCAAGHVCDNEQCVAGCLWHAHCAHTPDTPNCDVTAGGVGVCRGCVFHSDCPIGQTCDVDDTYTCM